VLQVTHAAVLGRYYADDFHSYVAGTDFYTPKPRAWSGASTGLSVYYVGARLCYR